MREALLFLAGLLAGADNAVAGGGSILVFPLLLSLGLPPIIANATCGAGIWPGAVGTVFGYRKPIQQIPKSFFWLLVPGVGGGLIGAILLSRTTNAAFEGIVPWFILAACGLLALQPRIHAWLISRDGRRFRQHNYWLILFVVGILNLGIAIYGGYFGAGIGIIILAFLSLTKLRNLQQMNGLKIMIAAVINLTAIIYFILHGLIWWKVLPSLAGGTAIGGWLGAKYSSLLPDNLIRRLIIAIGLILAAGIFIQHSR